MYYRHTYRLIKNEKKIDDTSMFLLYKKAISNYSRVYGKYISISDWIYPIYEYTTPITNKNKCLWHKN